MNLNGKEGWYFEYSFHLNTDQLKSVNNAQARIVVQGGPPQRMRYLPGFTGSGVSGGGAGMAAMGGLGGSAGGGMPGFGAGPGGGMPGMSPGGPGGAMSPGMPSMSGAPGAH